MAVSSDAARNSRNTVDKFTVPLTGTGSMKAT